MVIRLNADDLTPLTCLTSGRHVGTRLELRGALKLNREEEEEDQEEEQEVQEEERQKRGERQ